MNPPAPSVPSAYQKLPGSGWAALQHVRLYLGPDHLLQVTSNGFTESYQRFFFQDIQAITYHHTIAGKVWNGVFFGLAAFFLMLGLAAGDGAIVPVSVVALIWMAALAINVVVGPTCACYLKTAVQTRKLPSLGRVRRARKVIDRLRPAIAVAQGQYSAEELARELNPEMVAAAPATPTAPVTSGAESDSTRSEPRPEASPPVVDRPA